MIDIGEFSDSLSKGHLFLQAREIDFGYSITGSVKALAPKEFAREHVFVAPKLFDIKYYVDIEPDITLLPNARIRISETVPIGVEVWIGDVRIGEFYPKVKRAYIGEPSNGFFVLFVRQVRDEFPSLELDLEVVNETGETRFLDEISLNPKNLSVFEDQDRWVSERLIISVKPDDIEVKHTDQGPGKKVIQGKHEPEINRRFKRIARGFKDVF